ncbi:hypothetical protein bhYOR_001370 (plasmid) [Borrelia nietonii YOR]|nr:MULTISPECIES: hypothetical protein [Borrelia]UPA10025.1 hypothetical protein bhYOR_001370 [Borrelia nietonii YOR]
MLSSPIVADITGINTDIEEVKAYVGVATNSDIKLEKGNNGGTWNYNC